MSKRAKVISFRKVLFVSCLLFSISGCGDDQVSALNNDIGFEVKKHGLASASRSDFKVSDAPDLPEEELLRIKSIQQDYPRTRAWFLRGAVDLLVVSPDEKVFSENWGHLWAQALIKAGHLPKEETSSYPLTLGGMYPYVKTISIPRNCMDFDSAEKDKTFCNDSETLNAKTDKSDRVLKDADVADLLWKHFLAFVNQYESFFKVSSSFLEKHYYPVSVRRTKSMFALTVERNFENLKSDSLPLRIHFGEEGQILLMAGGLFGKEALNNLKNSLAQQLNQDHIFETINTYVNTESHATIPINILGSELIYDTRRGRPVKKVVFLREDSKTNWIVYLDVETKQVYTLYPYEDYSPYNDASVMRAFYSNGNLQSPSWIVSGNIYTRSDNSLEHDFFYIMNEGRCEGQTPSTCTQCSGAGNGTQHCSINQIVDDYCNTAYSSSPGSNGFIRASKRSARDFQNLAPRNHVESHVYHWARWYMQFQKEALDRAGLLDQNASNYTKSLVVVNPCRRGSYHSLNEFVRTEGGKGDGLSRVFLRTAHQGSHSYTTYSIGQEDVFFPSPGVIDHEMNHYVMHRYLGVNSHLDCGASEPNENRLLHEGVFGSLLPHIHWQSLYSIGYSPSPTSRLWFSNSDVGRVHFETNGLLTRSDYSCSDSPYEAGRVLSQALWKIMFGTHWDEYGQPHSIAKVSDKDDLVHILYEAAIMSNGMSLEAYAYLVTWMAALNGHLPTLEDVDGWCNMFNLHLPGIKGNYFASNCNLF